MYQSFHCLQRVEVVIKLSKLQLTRVCPGHRGSGDTVPDGLVFIPVVFIPVTVDTTGRLYDEFIRKGTVGLIMTKSSVMWISIPLDLSSRSFIPLPRFIHSRRPTPLLVASLVLFPPRSA